MIIVVQLVTDLWVCDLRKAALFFSPIAYLMICHEQIRIKPSLKIKAKGVRLPQMVHLQPRLLQDQKGYKVFFARQRSFETTWKSF
ncbi:Hypothetical predicted protein [Cloeon dipterum]|uniref:Uncharacterized protein n=1 Tax=Cloeon dipterum TaxID=197152 RepID=A0A8S1DFC0_9INSE|nr:Hypothetical predicted protein [Cloeon dipterum]